MMRNRLAQDYRPPWPTSMQRRRASSFACLASQRSRCLEGRWCPSANPLSLQCPWLLIVVLARKAICSRVRERDHEGETEMKKAFEMEEIMRRDASETETRLQVSPLFTLTFLHF